MSEVFVFVSRSRREMEVCMVSRRVKPDECAWDGELKDFQTESIAITRQ